MAPGAVLFDVFGTVVDWRGSVVAELARRFGEAPTGEGWGPFADRWRREGYLAPVTAMASGRAGRRPIEEVLAEHLLRLAGEAGVGLDRRQAAEVTGVWDRLEPWPDAIEGLRRIGAATVVGTLSNGSFAGLARMARHAGLPWHCVISAELFGSYKPDPAVYSGAAALLGLTPSDIVLVAAHPPDLRAARSVGMATAYVARPLEWGPAGEPVEPDAAATWVADDFVELADRLATGQ